MLQYDVNQIIMYLRKSRADNENETVEEVVAKHEKILQDYSIKAFGAPIPQENILKEVVSGETIDNRPQMKQILSLCANTERFKAILVIEPQRLSRGDMLDCGTIMRVFKYNNINIITPQKEFCLADQYDAKYFQMTLQQGNEYLEYVKLILNRGRLASVKNGCYIGNTAPYGYDKFKKDNKYTLTPSSCAPIVEMIFDMYVNQNMGCNMIATELDRQGIKPQISEYWNPATIRDILSNPVYIGKIRWNNKKTITKTDEFGNTITSRPRNKDDVIIVDGLHPAIIDDEIFNKAQSKTVKNARTPKSKELVNPLATLIKCGKCGYSMTLRKYYTNGEERSAPRLLCTHQSHCRTASATYEEIIDTLISALKAQHEDYTHKLTTATYSTVSFEKNILYTMKKEMKNIETQENRLCEFLEKGLYNEDMFKRRNEVLQQRKKDLSKAIYQKETDIPKLYNYEEITLNLHTAIEMLKDDTISPKEKNDFLKKFIKEIRYHSSLDSLGNRFIENDFSLEIVYL